MNIVKTFTADEEAKIKDLYIDQEFGLLKTSKSMGMGVERVKRYLRNTGLLRSKEEWLTLRGNAIALKFTDWEKEDISNMYRRGIKILQITSKYNCSYTPIIRVLLESGIDVADRYVTSSPSIEKLIKDIKDSRK